MAGAVTVSKYQLSQDKKVLVIKLACVGDASNGSVPNTTIVNADLMPVDDEDYHIDYTKAGFSLTELWVTIGATAPDEAGITITDALACQLYTEADVIPGAGAYNKGSVTKTLVTSALTVAVANQATASATYDIYLKLTR